MTTMQSAKNASSIEVTEASKPQLEPWAVKTLAIGGVLGASAGLLAAYLLINNSKKTGVQPTVSPREGFQIAVLLFGVVRSIANLWEA